MFSLSMRSRSACTIELVVIGALSTNYLCKIDHSVLHKVRNIKLVRGVVGSLRSGDDPALSGVLEVGSELGSVLHLLLHAEDALIDPHHDEGDREEAHDTAEGRADHRHPRGLRYGPLLAVELRPRSLGEDEEDVDEDGEEDESREHEVAALDGVLVAEDEEADGHEDGV